MSHIPRTVGTVRNDINHRSNRAYTGSSTLRQRARAVTNIILHAKQHGWTIREAEDTILSLGLKVPSVLDTYLGCDEVPAVPTEVPEHPVR